MFRINSIPLWVWVLGALLLLLVLLKFITRSLVFLITAAAIVFLTIFANLTVQNYLKTNDWKRAFERTLEDFKKLFKSSLG